MSAGVIALSLPTQISEEQVYQPIANALLVVPDLATGRRHHPDEREVGWIVGDDVPCTFEQVELVEDRPTWTSQKDGSMSPKSHRPTTQASNSPGACATASVRGD